MADGINKFSVLNIGIMLTKQRGRQFEWNRLPCPPRLCTCSIVVCPFAVLCPSHIPLWHPEQNGQSCFTQEICPIDPGHPPGYPGCPKDHPGCPAICLAHLLNTVDHPKVMNMFKRFVQTAPAHSPLYSTAKCGNLGSTIHTFVHAIHAGHQLALPIYICHPHSSLDCTLKLSTVGLVNT